MRVDVFLRSESRRIIIDTKYYASALQQYHGTDSFHSGNLYLLFGYLKNAAGKDVSFINAEGILLYPQVGAHLNEVFEVQGHQITIATIDLAMPWSAIDTQLRSLLKMALG